jgi:hypothetical protein
MVSRLQTERGSEFNRFSTVMGRRSKCNFSLSCFLQMTQGTPKYYYPSHTVMSPVEGLLKRPTSIAIDCYSKPHFPYFFKLQALAIRDFEKFDFTLLQSSDFYRFTLISLALM